MYQVELVWNREFHWVPFGNPHPNLSSAIKAARAIENSGDGARVKKTRISDENGDIIWAYGKMTTPSKTVDQL